MESGSGKGTEGGSGKLKKKQMRKEKELSKKTESESGKGTEIESGKDQDEKLRKELKKLTKEYERLRFELSQEGEGTVRHFDKNPRQRKGMLRDLEMVLNNIEIELGKGTERDSIKEPEIERDSIKEPEIERDSDSDCGDEIGTDWWASLISMEPQPQLGISKGTGTGTVSKEPAMERDEMKELSKKQSKLLKQKQSCKERDSGTFSSKHQTLVKELISAERERKDLLVSITPTFSLWKQVDSQKTWRRQPCPAPAARDDGEQQDLADYLNSMLQAMEDMGHRMLSMLDFLNKSDSPGSICLYKASELHTTAVRLNMLISKEFNTDQHPETMQVQEEEDLSVDLLSLFTKYSQFPNNYHNTLSQLVIMEEDEEKKHEVAKVEEEEQDKDQSTMEYLKERMDIEQQFLAYDRTYWEDVWGSRIGRCGRFMDTSK